jgi:hypothetical protein
MQNTIMTALWKFHATIVLLAQTSAGVAKLAIICIFQVVLGVVYQAFYGDASAIC